jgi:hypothetical protein
MIDAALVVLQNLTDSEKEQGLCNEMSPAASQDAYQAISVKAEVLSDVEEEDPLAVPFPELKAEPEVSCVSVSMINIREISQVTYPLYPIRACIVGQVTIQCC